MTSRSDTHAINIHFIFPLKEKKQKQEVQGPKRSAEHQRFQTEGLLFGKSCPIIE